MPELSRKKKILFSLLPTALLLVLLAAVELVLRAALPAPDRELTREVTYDGLRWHEINRAYLARYFPAGAPVVPEFKPALFRKEKLPRHLRVVCLGGSTMFGVPYLYTTSIPGIVRKQLRHLAPETEIEVLNLGASAIGSRVIRDFAPEVLRYEPDCVLISMGHNEFYGPEGVGASALEKALPFLTSLKYAAGNLRLFQVVSGWIAPEAAAAQKADPNLMRQVSAGSLVDLDSKEAARIFRNFRTNLEEILSVFDAAHVPVIVSDVASNLRFPPFAGDSLRTVPDPAAFLDSVDTALRAGEYGRVLEMRARLGPADSANAGMLYREGLARASLGDSSGARSCLRRAVDRDLLKFRAPAEVNTIIAQVCRERGVRLVSTAEDFASVSPGGIAGDSLFWEHLHPTALGYYRIANLFVNAIIDQGLVRPDAGSSLLPFERHSLGLSWIDLAYADLSIQRLTGRWPFEDYRRLPAVLDGAEGPLQEIAVQTYRRQLSMDEGALKSATYFWGRGRFREALTTYEALLDEYPAGFYTNYLAASLLNQMGRGEEAIARYHRSIASNPKFSRARLDLGLILVNAGEFAEGIRHLDEVLRLEGTGGDRATRAGALTGMAAARANLGEMTAAMAALDQAIALDPANREARSLRERIASDRTR
jgi:tetratricopeptide (TPR) repeat protein